LTSSRRQLDWRIAVRESDLKKAAKLVALVLDTYMDGSGVAWPSRETIAHAASLSVDIVDRALSEIERAGLLTIERSRGRLSNGYQATIPNRPVVAAVEGGAERPTAASTGVNSRKSTPPTAAPVRPEAVKKPPRKPKSVDELALVPRADDLEVVDGEAIKPVSAQALVAFYVDRAHAAGVANIPASRPARVGQQVKRLLAEGIPPDVLELALQRMIDRNAQPSLLPDLVVDVQSPPATPRYPRNEHVADRLARHVLRNRKGLR
jgi:hypothetical protein